ncbi:rod shape-determining protein RodA [Desertifilum sp. FACHB-1129]|uniref:Peptidoglycan glycosyltransferase RodA n=1 Tax=Desertifilum tharense IPPAS B-1220 TaxID=1781255 RepID=A0A1E5QHI1_9CYAN|nr:MULTISPECIES: rod shape-determining protein RodA [unclassified Desertifilum]MDA0211306.1 rod shape-determining protein RodA [Cyanobacteria bacterium FC1]OEJ74142.1 rod shape-determining protein RodA [Desertifilum tharense IPPAS B-1220]MBD2314672.1 rod shape-determining protein RodA [Desertifilum sp. FACHB-1129]MBD2320268.1 rod shape-determining protein RodA [Desertifilum sp. FACHB-866]MBD2330396.1 rod shape-determining protein RodA [Desertifilum sp. FACHB-868]
MLQKRLMRRVNWTSFLYPWQRVDWLLLFLSVGLTTIGGIMIRSTELNLGWTDWWQHWLVGGIGLVLAMLLARWHYKNLLQLQWVIYAITNLSLIAVIFIGTTALGAQRWITIGGFNLQPSEFAKLGLIITLACLLHTNTASTIPMLLKTLGIALVPWILVFLQPDLGTSLVFGAITLGMLYWGNANPGWLVLLVSPVVSAILFNIYLPGWLIWAVLLAIVAWFSLPWPRLGSIGAVGVNFAAGELGFFLWGLLKDYQKDRLILFLNPEKDPLGGGYHLIQSRIAIGAGELWGRGLNQGTQTQLNFIPEQHTDFIFSAIGEELGFVGCVAMLAVFWLICLRLVLIAQNAQDNFGSLLAIGVLSMVVFQVVVNIGMTIGLAPVTGIPLPWMSYGRSALLTNFLAIGLVESVANHQQKRRF